MSIRWMTWAWDQDCANPGQKLTLMALCDHAGDDGMAFPGSARLAEKTGQTAASVRRHLDALEAAGLMTRERRRKTDGRLGTYDYQLHQRALSPIGEHDAPPARKGARAEPSVEPSVLGEDDGAAFEKFWDTYEHTGPRKVALARWLVARKKATAEQIQTGLEAWMTYWKTPGAAAIKWPQGWLNDERWNDTPPIVRPEPVKVAGASKFAAGSAAIAALAARGENS